MNTIGKDFMEYTKYKYLGGSDQPRGIEQPSLELDYDPSKPLINLHSPQEFQLGKISLIDAINNRNSHRKYSRESITLEELSFLLWATQGVKLIKDARNTFRTVPSAGAGHAFETFILVNRVEGLKPGLYRYIALRHKLIEVDASKGIKDRIVAGCLGQGFVGLSAATFIWVAVADRMKWRYGERAYRYLHLDAGHVCQNLYLAAEGIGCGACAVAAFDDDMMNEALGIDGVEQFTIYIAAVGKKVN